MGENSTFAIEQLARQDATMRRYRRRQLSTCPRSSPRPVTTALQPIARPELAATGFKPSPQDRLARHHRDCDRAGLSPYRRPRALGEASLWGKARNIAGRVLTIDAERYLI